MIVPNVGFRAMGRMLRQWNSNIEKRRKQDLVNRMKLQMATVDGVTHKLSWLDRSDRNYRLRCSCGWSDPTRQVDDFTAVKTGNAHIRGILRSGN